MDKSFVSIYPKIKEYEKLCADNKLDVEIHHKENDIHIRTFFEKKYQFTIVVPDNLETYICIEQVPVEIIGFALNANIKKVSMNNALWEKKPIADFHTSVLEAAPKENS